MVRNNNFFKKKHATPMYCTPYMLEKKRKKTIHVKSKSEFYLHNHALFRQIQTISSLLTAGNSGTLKKKKKG